MRKDTDRNVIYGRIALRAATLSFTLALALSGCTTNKTPGDGQPTSSPDVGPPNPSATPGSSSGSIPIPPQAMYSSSADSIAVLAADRAYNGHVLGPLDPGLAPSSGAPMPNGEQLIAPLLTVDPELMVESSPPPLFSLAGDVTGAPSAGVIGSAVATSPIAGAAAPGSVASANITPVALPIRAASVGNLVAGAMNAPGAGATTIADGTSRAAGTGAANGTGGIAGGTIASSAGATGIAGATAPALIAPQTSGAATSGITPSLPTPANIAGPGVAPALSSNVTSIPTIVPGGQTNSGSEAAGATATAGIRIERPFPATAADSANGSTMIAPASVGRVRAVRPVGGMTTLTIPRRTVRPGGTTPEPVKSAQTARTRVVEPPVAPSRTRPVRVMTASDGTIIVTNVPREQ